MVLDKITYKQAGVDTKKGAKIINDIKPKIKSKNKLVLSKIGSFSSLFKLPEGYKSPVLVSSTDGVGTKLKLAIDLNIHDYVGCDLVAMCVNDLITCGGKPLFFLDYYATGKLDEKLIHKIIGSIQHGCELSGCDLIGGETAEMPGMYQNKDYDLAGFAVGIVEQDNILPKMNDIESGMSLIGIESSGFHSNGYSLIRELINEKKIDVNSEINGQLVANLLLEPTIIYTNPVLDVISQNLVLACAHITGGGFYENIPRILPEHINANIQLDSWVPPDVYRLVVNKSFIEQNELLNVFNCGIGFIMIAKSDNVTKIIELLGKHSLTAHEVGSTTQGGNERITFSNSLNMP
ncbi:MAG: phosphoribosylformylglycinamidine cyclo-ligase [Francisellaceae bacterium]|nr:phosphoribosylformylglycinamidine cyclo-ligase [Francisellaceae bacterium]MBT6538464.1 phosphoribosylformylglycinamidine cyclo-ligase [Francisellaceae bacterium]